MSKKKIDEIEYVEVEGIKCKVRNPKKKAIAIAYQNSLRDAILDYERSIDRWSESKRDYRDNLNINVKIAPFVLGWLSKPEDEDEYRVINGCLTIEEFEAKRKKEANKEKKTRKPAAKKQDSIKKPIAPKKPETPKKPASPKKPTIKSISKKQDSTAKKSGSKNPPKKD